MPVSGGYKPQRSGLQLHQPGLPETCPGPSFCSVSGWGSSKNKNKSKDSFQTVGGRGSSRWKGRRGTTSIETVTFAAKTEAKGMPGRGQVQLPVK